jgi:hypothetical protein
MHTARMWGKNRGEPQLAVGAIRWHMGRVMRQLWAMVSYWAIALEERNRAGPRRIVPFPFIQKISKKTVMDSIKRMPSLAQNFPNKIWTCR